MDLIAFQKSRDAELSTFETEQIGLKQQYNETITNAISETDPDKQSELVKQILDVNKELSDGVREFVSKQSQGTPYDEKSVLALTNELIKYQKQYEQINSGNDKIKTLKLILSEDKDKLSSMQTQFNIMLGLTGLGIFLIVFMILKISITSSLPQ
jgi:vacuolar-type H+-ATPase subunit I/STV1